MSKELAEKLFIWAIFEYNKVRIKAKKQQKVYSEEQLVDESFNVWYENAKEIFNDQFSQLVKKVDELESKLSCISEQLDIVTEQRNDIHIDKKVLQEQLNEANEVIKKYRRFEVALKVEKGTLTGVYPAVDYLKKWGVK